MLKGPAHYSHSYLSCFKTLWWYVVVLSHFIWKNNSAKKLNMNCGPLSWVQSGLVWSLFFTYCKIEQSTLLEGLCVPGGSGCLIFRYMRDKVWIGTEWPQVGLRFWCSFFLLKSSFKWSVCYGVVPTTNLHTTSRERDRSVICICTLVTVPTVSLYKSLMKEKIDIRIIRLTF